MAQRSMEADRARTRGERMNIREARRAQRAYRQWLQHERTSRAALLGRLYHGVV